MEVKYKEPCENCLVLPVCIRQQKEAVKSKCIILRKYLIDRYEKNEVGKEDYLIKYIESLDTSFEVHKYKFNIKKEFLILIHYETGQVRKRIMERIQKYE
jgi:hypothetical protein